MYIHMQTYADRQADLQEGQWFPWSFTQPKIRAGNDLRGPLWKSKGSPYPSPRPSRRSQVPARDLNEGPTKNPGRILPFTLRPSMTFYEKERKNTSFQRCATSVFIYPLLTICSCLFHVEIMWFCTWHINGTRTRDCCTKTLNVSWIITFRGYKIR